MVNVEFGKIWVVGSKATRKDSCGSEAPAAIIKVVKEAEASDKNLQGPRLENGDYYEN